MATAVSEDEEDRAREKEGHPERKPVTDRKGRAILDGYPQVLVDDVTSKGRIAGGRFRRGEIEREGHTERMGMAEPLDDEGVGCPVEGGKGPRVE
ncbi:hypothetical protein RUM44_000191 [Polyplax serrata]|uniref:Uncharacterized protein n=1 Tax=Polyplax serrata TaxID=468196 RepID=A0ABR1B4U0_POLSC